MIRAEFEKAIGRAISDTGFCARLLNDPADALMDYGLGVQEALCLQGLQGASLDDLVRQIVRVGARSWGPEFRALRRRIAASSSSLSTV